MSTPEGLRDLRAKYVEMRSMREDHQRGGAIDPRPRMRALAQRFPGALREIDELPLEIIEGRIEEIETALAGAGTEPQWARCASIYHAWMRAVLGLRRAAGRTRDRGAALRWLAEEYAPSGDEPAPRELERAIDDLLKPPEGRLHRWVIARIADAEGLRAHEIDALIFPRHARTGER